MWGTPGFGGLNESPSEKEGKFVQDGDFKVSGVSLNESPSEKEGKSPADASPAGCSARLNESPSEKEGKYCQFSGILRREAPQ